MIEILLFFGSLGSRTINAVFFRGSIHQTFSARAHIEARNYPAWEPIEAAIDWLASPFEKHHCSVAWRDEVHRATKTLMRESRSKEPDYLQF